SFGKAINDSVPTGTSPPNNRLGGDRIEIAVAPSDMNVVYVTGASGINGNCTGVWKSTDSGVNFTTVAPFESATFQPFQQHGRYSLVLAVKPSDPDAIVLGGEKLYKYDPNTGWDDAASHTFIPGFSTNYVPTPIVSLCFDPNSDSTYYVGTDAEIVRTTDYGQTFSFKTKGFNNAHLYGVHAAPNWKILASDRYQGLLYKNNGNGQSFPNGQGQQFNDIYGSTGGGVARFSLTNPEFIVSQTNAGGDPGGLVRSLSNGATFESFYGFPKEPNHPSLTPDSLIVDRPDTATGGAGVYDAGGSPITPWAFDEYIDFNNLPNEDVVGIDSSLKESPVYVYMASRHFVWVACNPFGTLDSVPFWNRVSNNLVDNFFGVGKKEFITALTPSNDADHVVYVGTSRGKIYRIEDANDPANMDVTTKVNWVNLGAGMPERWITDIEFDQGNRDNVVVTYGSYASGDDRVWITNDAKGASPTFRSIQDNLPADIPVYSAAFHPYGPATILVLGTEEGVYATNSNYENAGTTIDWDYESNGVGTTPVYDIFFRPYYANYTDPNSTANWTYSPDHTLFIATHGRGVFKSTSLTYNIVSREEATLVESGIKVDLSPNPTAS
ncbi:MAG: hypothetical protein AAF570_18110, partial [Bacteroidota bacterium]